MIRVYDDTSAAGTLLDTVHLAANASDSRWYGPNGIKCGNGVHVDLVSGAVEYSVRVAR